MSHLPLDDWTRLSDEWRAQPRTDDVDQLRHRVRVQTKRLYAIVAVEVLLSIAAVIVIPAMLIRAPDLESRLLAGGLAIFTAVVWGFGVRSRRGIWRAAGDTLAAYRALERERLRRRIAGARFAWQVCVVALVPMLFLTARRITGSGPMSASALVTAGACIYLLAWIVGGRVIETRLARRVVPLSDDE